MTRKSSVMWLSMAAALTFLYWITMLKYPFAPTALEPHAWASAHMAVLARSFAELGIVHLHGVPLQNNLPIGAQPDRYVHWPPLYPMLLSVMFQIFGESEASVHAFVILVNVCYVASFYFLVRHCFDKNVAILSVFGLLTIPVFVQYGRLAWTPNAALCAVCAALYCFVRGTEKNLSWRWILAGSIAVAIGVFFSWEAAPLGFVLLVLATSQQSKIRQIAAATYSVAGIGAVAIVLVLLVSASNDIRNELWATVRFRMGGVYQPTAIPIHALADHVLYTKQHTNLLSWILNILDNWLPRLGGTVGLSSTIGVSLWAWRRRKARPDVLFVVVGLLGIVVVWAVLFPNHITHEYEPLIAAPLFGIAIGVVLKIGGERLKGTGRLVVSIIVPLILIIPLARQAMIAFRRPQPDKIIKYAKDIEGSTPPSAVILSPVDTMVTVYYSRRHIIRSVTDDETLRLVMQQAGSVFPNTDIYIAIPPDSLGWFPCAASRFPLVRHTGNVILLRVTADTCESRSVAEK